MPGKGGRTWRGAIGAAVVSCGAAWASPALAAIHVDATAPAGGDGQTWSTAYRFLQDGLARAAEVGTPTVEVRIAKGVYLPDRDEGRPGGSHSRMATFALLDRVVLRGGYAGLGSPDPDERDIEQYETVLSGDLGRNDGPGYFGYLENSYHVVTAVDINAGAVLDGLTIASGHSDGAFGIHNFGAGLLCIRSSPTLDRCTIRDNLSGYQGAGVQCKDGSAPLFTNCDLRNNRALDNGGAMYNGGSSPVMIDCTFSLNSGVVYAGGVCNRDLSNARFERCEFFANIAAEDEALGGGGGAMVNASSNPDVIDCTFTSNLALFGKGGAVVNEPGLDPKLGGSAPTIEGSTFENNRAILGGAMYNVESDPLVTGCQFTRNRASGYFGRNAGGAIYNGLSDARFEDCGFTRNEAARGGAVYNNEGGNPVYEACVFTENTAVSDAGGAMSSYYASTTVVDCTFVGNAAATGGGGFQNFVANATLTRCRVEGNHSDTDGGGIYSIQSVLVVDECTLTANTAPGAGGALFNGQFSETTLTGCVISANAAGVGGAAQNHALSTLAVADTMCCANTPDDFDGGYDDNGGNEFLAECPAPCPADLDGDGMVGFTDLVRILGAWGACSGCPEDLDGDGAVGFQDVLEVLGAWGVCA